MKKHNGILKIKNLIASVDGKQVLNGVSLTVRPGETHVIMGPNGSGKSTFANVLMGNPAYEVQRPIRRLAEGQIKIDTKNIIDLPTEERAKAGLFLAFQAPVTLPGVTVINLLRSAYLAIHEKKKTREDTIQNPLFARRMQEGTILADFTKKLKTYTASLHIDESLLRRGIGDGFSGGEKKKMEMLQALVLTPKFAVFDEIDTGLDVDALKVVALSIALLKKHGTGVIVITHYQRILQYIKPDVVHILVAGNIVDTGTATLAKKIEQKGYEKYL